MPRMNVKQMGNFDKKGTFKRLIKYVFKSYPIHFIVIIICIIISAVGAIAASIFMQRFIDDVIMAGIRANGSVAGSGFETVKPTLIALVISLSSVYLAAILASTLYQQLLCVVTQGFLDKVRCDMFSKMEKLPISYFDRNQHGDIMSTYTNDVDAIRQVVSTSLPQFVQVLLTVLMLFGVMLYYSIWLTLVVIVAVIFIYLATSKIGGGSAKYFIRQQKSVAKCEGFIEEMMNGQRVVKVFCHEEKAKADFEVLNEELNHNAFAANAYANMLVPIIHNIANLLYVVVAIVGVVLVINNVPNLSLRGFGNDEATALTIGIAVTYLGMARQFGNQFNQISQQLNSVVMALAGAKRIFDLMDQEPEKDEGYVSLVNCHVKEDGTIVECEEHTGHWAWKHPHKEDGTITYTELKGDIRLFDVDFGYVPEKIVLHDVSVYAKPGQKIAFVGATGAGKTTITNLINRFYDIQDGKIRFDGININKIKKDDLRKSIGIVLQDTNLFTGTVADNIRYGKLNATEAEIEEAAKIANAYDFITRLPDGFNTMLTGNGSQLSQGQRQLISIARAALADAPVMILDEATSSIDTRTELLVSRGMDGLMEGRTVFVIAHRLSTVQNSNAIIVLDHGRIIERGDHDDLIKAKGTYYQLYTGAFELE
ncbi:MAG: ABC transporter ATP-binding protein/permease [Acholeplasmatales bacterium]|nr:ABC transporter ATP-binding protein/permease [Acholeplasmatales bacterium]